MSGDHHIALTHGPHEHLLTQRRRSLASPGTITTHPQHHDQSSTVECQDGQPRRRERLSPRRPRCRGGAGQPHTRLHQHPSLPTLLRGDGREQSCAGAAARRAAKGVRARPDQPHANAAARCRSARTVEVNWQPRRVRQVTIWVTFAGMTHHIATRRRCGRSHPRLDSNH